MAPVTKILVPTDFSETADAALEYAKVLAGQLGASLHLLHVFSDPYAVAAHAPDVYATLPPTLRERALEEARECLRQRLTADEEERFRGTCDIVSGLTAKQIVEYAARTPSTSSSWARMAAVGSPICCSAASPSTWSEPPRVRC